MAGRFSKTSFDDECLISEYRVAKVIDFTGAEIDEAAWKQLFTLDNMTGDFTVLDYTTGYSDYFIFVEAFNTEIWSDSTVTGHLIEQTNIPKPPNFPPEF